MGITSNLNLPHSNTLKQTALGSIPGIPGGMPQNITGGMPGGMPQNIPSNIVTGDISPNIPGIMLQNALGIPAGMTGTIPQNIPGNVSQHINAAVSQIQNITVGIPQNISESGIAQQPNISQTQVRE